MNMPIHMLKNMLSGWQACLCPFQLHIPVRVQSLLFSFCNPFVVWSIWLQSAAINAVKYLTQSLIQSLRLHFCFFSTYGQWSQRWNWLNIIKPFLQNDHFCWARWRITKYELGTRHQGSHGHYLETACSYSLLHMFFLLMPSSIQSQYDLKDWNALERTSPQPQSKDYSNHRIPNIATMQGRIRDTSGTIFLTVRVRRRSGVECSALGFFNRSETDHRCFMMSQWCFISRTCERDARTVQYNYYNSDGNKARLMRVILAGEDEFLGWPAWIVWTNCDISGTCCLGVRQEKNPDALVEGISLLQNAQNLIGTQNWLRRRDGYERRMLRNNGTPSLQSYDVVFCCQTCGMFHDDILMYFLVFLWGAEETGESGSKSRVVLQALCLVDRKVKVRQKT